ncbi:MAG: glycosyltransferase family 2 protein [Myxococcota bacterium]|nr:glycosyltransferase family 2 protein [Myxococcota bacterium]
MGARVRYAFLLVGVVATLAAGALLLYWGLRQVRWDLPSAFVRGSMVVLLVFLLLLILRYLALLWFSYLNHLEEEEADPLHLPPVTILVPAYNEGPVIQGSIRSLLALDYPRYEILVIDDGSSDDTSTKARVYEGEHGGATVRVIRKRNGGKARALNTGISQASSPFVLCMDGDSALHPKTLRRAVRHMVNHPSVGAVAGSVKVVNRTNMLATLQALEYVEGLNMVRSAQAFFRLVNIVPGPIGLFRRSALERVGGYDHDTFAEDCDLTLKLISDGWQVRYEPGAVAYTEAPESLLDLLKQRYRWTRGILQAIGKHKRALVDPRRGVAISFTLWYMIFEGIAWPSLNVFAHILFVWVATLHGTALPLVLWFAQLTILDLAAALYCVAVEEESLALVPYAVLYRAFFALTIDTAKLFATLEEMFKLRMEWGKLDRIGRI